MRVIGFCGMRQAEICRLDWSVIDFNQMLMEHYRELVTKEDAEKWFATFPAKPGANGETRKPREVSCQTENRLDRHPA